MEQKEIKAPSNQNGGQNDGRNNEITMVKSGGYTMEINHDMMSNLFYLCLGAKNMREQVDEVVSFIMEIWADVQDQMDEHETVGILKILNQIKMDYKMLNCVHIANGIEKAWE